MSRGWLPVLLSGILLFSSCASSNSRFIGAKAADFTLPSLQDRAREITLSDFNRDNPVLLVFWATWCPSCKKEIPHLSAASQAAPQGLKVLAVSVEENREKVLDFTRRHPLNYDVLLDEQGSVAQLYGIDGIPVVILLAKGGEILYYGFRVPKHLDQLLETKESSKL